MFRGDERADDRKFDFRRNLDVWVSRTGDMRDAASTASRDVSKLNDTDLAFRNPCPSFCFFSFGRFTSAEESSFIPDCCDLLRFFVTSFVSVMSNG